MKINKNIDRLFQEKFKDFEVSPPDNVWKGIERNIKNNKPKALLPLWLRIGGAAAILMLLSIGGANYFNLEPSEIIDNNSITDSDDVNDLNINKDLLERDLLNSTQKEDIIIVKTSEEIKNGLEKKTKNSNNTKEVKENIANSIKNIQNSVVENNARGNRLNPSKTLQENKNDINKSGVIIANNDSSNLKKEPSKQSQKNNKENTSTDLKKVNTRIANNTSIENYNKYINNNTKGSKFFNFDNPSSSTDNTTLEDTLNKEVELNKTKSSNSETDFKETLEDKTVAAQTKNSEDNIVKDILGKDTKKWSVASIFAPVFYNSFNAKGSPLDSQFKDSPKKGSRTMSYGVKVSYKINNKLSLQSGVSLVNVGYKISDVFITPRQQPLQRLANVTYLSSANIMNVSADNFLINLQETTSSTATKGVLNQDFGYIELPLELRYNLSKNEKKLGISLVGGFSTLFLNKNEVYVKVSEFSSNIGKANNLNNVNFSGNIGIDVDYKINKNFYFNAAPMLKIHTSTFSKNTNNFKPYTLGVYTGLNYKF